MNDSSHLTIDFVAFLPPELIEEIFSYLPVRDLIVCGAVSVSWRIAANNLCLWRKLEKNYERWLLPDSKVKRSDIITSNFPDKSRSLEAIMPKDNLSPFNPLKFFVFQRNFLKYNWRNGIYTDYWLGVKTCIEFVYLKVFYPSKSPYDCLYYPFSGKLKDGSYGLFLLRLDAKPKVVGRLPATKDNVVRSMCVMRDCLVWLSEEKVQYFSLISEFEKTEVRTLGILDFASEGCVAFLTMDANNIVVATSALRIWCKQTLTLKFVYKPQTENSLCACCLYDGCLIYAFKTTNNVSSIKIFSVKKDVMFENEFTLDGSIQTVKCDKSFIILEYYHHLPNTHIIQVRNKYPDFTIKFSHRTRYPIHEIFNEFITFVDYTSNKIELLNYVTGEYQVVTQFNGELYLVFDNIAALRGENHMEVWDYKKRIKLYNLYATDTPGSHSIVHISEARVLSVDCSCNFKIFGFG